MLPITFAFLLANLLGGAQLMAQISLAGSGMALKSQGSATLSNLAEDSGYVGTYITVPAGGATVNFDINASEGSGSAPPHLNLSIADSNFGFNVNSASATNYNTSNVTLPAGTYFVSVQRDYPNNSALSAPFTVNNLAINTVSGASPSFSNVSSDANALAAATTYITNFRQGPATVHMSGPGGVPLLPGTPVTAKLANIAFNFGDAVPGTSDSGVASYLGGNAGSYSSLQSNFQSQLNQNFNTVVLENDGKWSSNESFQNFVDMNGVNTFLNYAQSHQMTARMHNLIWGPAPNGNQQPGWVNNLVTSGNASAVSSAIASRIGYYVGNGSSDDPALKFQQIDVYNEGYHTGQAGGTDTYWNVLGGASGIANVYNQVAAAIANDGSKAVTFTNEYNVFQNSNDNYANWYLQNIDAIRDAGGNVGEIGIEYYPESATYLGGGIGSGNSQHSAARIESVLESLAAQGLPVQVDEFGVGAGGSTATVDQILSDTMTLMFGNPNATGFVMWGDENASSGDLYKPAAAFYNVSNGVWTLTSAGQTWQHLLGIDGNPDGWTTNVSLTTNADGAITFNGYYGQYYLSGQPLGNLNAKVLPYDLNLVKGTTTYSTTLASPPGWFFWKTNGSGSWSGGENWTDASQSGAAPATAGETAYFGSNATGYNMNTGAATTYSISTPTATISLTDPISVGMLVFDNAITSYTLTGSSISLQGYDNSNGHAAAIYVSAGTHSIQSALRLLDNTTITVAPLTGAVTIFNLQPSAVNLVKAGAGILAVNNLQLNNVTIDGGTLRLLAGGGQSSVQSLRIADGATLDIANNSVRILYNSTDPLDGIAADVGAAYDNGQWDLPGITSSAITSVSDGTAIAINDDGSAVTIRYTWYGDANGDGTVNQLDFNDIISGGQGWSEGDFNYDGVVNADDWALFALGKSISNGQTISVPEPDVVVPSVVGLVLVTFRRKLKK